MSEAEKKSIVIVLRSLANSQKNASVDDLMRDYAQTEGGRIPYHKFGFCNLADFLNASGEFYVNAYGIVQVKQSAESAHISKLVAEQNCSKKKKKVKAYYVPQRNLNPSTVRFQYQPGPRKQFNAPPVNVYKWTANSFKPAATNFKPANQYPPPGYNDPGFSYTKYNAIHHKQP